jgi:hypothetical protein
MSQTVGRELSQLTVVPQAASPAPSGAAASARAVPSTGTPDNGVSPLSYGFPALAALAVVGALFLVAVRLRRT